MDIFNGERAEESGKPKGKARADHPEESRES
jgi:hypothetical protein